MPIKLSMAPQQFVNESGKPLAGRVTLYHHDSNEIATVYTMQGDQFVEAQNPQLLDELGKISETLFFDADILDVRVDKYIGEAGGMTVDSPNFSLYDEFQVGMDYKALLEQSGATDSVNGLKDIDPAEFQLVEVRDIPYRRYVWDAYATNTPDDGIVVESNVTASGRWLLLWDDEMLPSSIYGVEGGHTANLSALMNYPEIVGSIQLHTPPIVRFVPGNYPLTTNISGTKTVAFEDGVTFTGGSLVVPSAIALTPVTRYVCDFSFTRDNVEAHSSWFRTLTGFWNCGAKKFIVDDTNYFTSTVLTNSVGLEGKIVEGAKTLVTTYSSGMYFSINSASAIPSQFFRPDDYVRIKSDVDDHILTTAGSFDFGLINAGHHFQYDVNPVLAKWGSVNRWIQVMLERKQRVIGVPDELNLENRTISGTVTIENGSFPTISNAVFTGTLLLKGTATTLRNVRGTVQVNSSGLSLAVFDSDITISASHSGLDVLSARDSRISVPGANGLNPANTQIAMVGCTYSGAIKITDVDIENNVVQPGLSLLDCEIQNNLTWRVNQIMMQGCSLANKVDIFPVKASDGYYYYNVNIDTCHFTGNSRLWFTVHCTYDVPHIDMDGHVKFNMVRIVKNRFDTGDAYGVKMMFWHPYTYNRLVADSIGNYNYYGNTGNCPRLTPGFIVGADPYPSEQGSTNKWRVTTAEYNIWCPYAYYGDGSVYAVDTDPSGLGLCVPVASVISLSNISNNWGWCYFGFRRYATTLTDYTNEDENNMFRVLAAVGYKLPSVTSFNNTYTMFPLPYPEDF